MSTTTQVWETYERIVTDTIDESCRALEEEDGQDYGKVLSELRRVWEEKLVQSGALALGAEVDPNSQTAAIGLKQEEGVKKEEEEKGGEAAGGASSKRKLGEQGDGGKDGEDNNDDGDNGDGPRKKRAKVEGGEDAGGTSAAAGAAGDAEAKAVTELATSGNVDDIDVDDDIDDLLLGSEDPTKDLVLAQVEKKFKSKNKYRFLFKSGILQIDGLEYVFEKGNGDFKW